MFLQVVRSDMETVAVIQRQLLVDIAKSNSVLEWICSVLNQVKGPEYYILLALKQLLSERHYRNHDCFESLVVKATRMKEAVEVRST